jgi:hypothetical protein
LTLYIFKNNTTLREIAGASLARAEEGITELANIIKDDRQKEFHIPAIKALGNEFSPGCYLSFSDARYSSDGNKPKILLSVLSSFAASPNVEISYLAIIALWHSYSLSQDLIELMLKGDDQRKKILGLKDLRSSLRADDPTCERHLSTIVELLEDESSIVSEESLEVIRYFSRVYSAVIAYHILDVLVLRLSNRPQEFFNVNIAASALRETFKFNPRLQGQVLYKIREIAFQNTGNTRSRAVFIGISLSKKEFLSLVNELKETDPKIANSIAHIVSGSLESAQIVREISETDPKDIQQNAANQLNLLTRYYESGLAQAKNSFNWAVGITVFCVLSFLAVVFIFGQNEDKTIVWLSALASGIAEIIAGTLLVIYKQSLLQLNNYNHQMSKIQNYLLANSFIESLSDEAKDNARLELIKSVAIGQTNLTNNN